MGQCNATGACTQDEIVVSEGFASTVLERQFEPEKERASVTESTDCTEDFEDSEADDSEAAFDAAFDVELEKFIAEFEKELDKAYAGYDPDSDDYDVRTAWQPPRQLCEVSSVQPRVLSLAETYMRGWADALGAFVTGLC
mmetsp:Transcript_31186/g.56562  ORF Transcript_31186/g.56562 Transcript_31186/m.56562 type:complete len:140 (+) Transcript_31186:105-524(+)